MDTPLILYLVSQVFKYYFGYVSKGSSVRKQILTFLKQKFATVEDAEAQYGLNVDHYLDSPYFKDKENRNDQQGVETPRSSKPSLRSLNKAEMLQLFSDIIVKLAPVEVTSVLLSYLRGLKSLNEIVTTVTTLLHSFTTTKKQEIADSLFSSIATDLKLDSNPHGFVTLSLAAMNRLQQNGKNNLVFKFSQAIAGTRSDAKTPLIELNRMPFGLIEYAIEFFTCTSVHQVYAQWYLRHVRGIKYIGAKAAKYQLKVFIMCWVNLMCPACLYVCVGGIPNYY